ncbi:sensor histidine kinase [Paenibacillus silvisoli]|uniref:sensor histidine kinase n=1 Tax=Paenibacillus silvisoli TaxID=3110539 RepID=UPI00280408B6|nr:ATP-binding protein [Paenibacillus silvisoli]
MIKHTLKASQRLLLSLKGPSSIGKLVLLYRYASLMLTSVFYLLEPQSTLLLKGGVILSVAVAARIVTDLQRKYDANPMLQKSIVLTETIGLTLLLIPTGGISSPFIWYALNPVLVAASFLSSSFCWGTLAFYLVTATAIANRLFHTGPILATIEANSYIYLVCFLTTLLTRLFADLTKQLDAKAALLHQQQLELLLINQKLSGTNDKYQHTLEQMMTLYRVMESFSSQKSAAKLVQEVTSSLMKCTQSDAAFFWLNDLHHQKEHFENQTDNPRLEALIKEDWSKLRGKSGTIGWLFHEEKYALRIIRTSSHTGILGMRTANAIPAGNRLDLNRPLEFLSQLSETMLERMHMDLIMDQMLVTEEQNRIANDIHDSVSQRLFGISCSLHSLQVKGPGLKQEQLNEEYRFLSQSANTTLKELRSAIYRLSSVKKGEMPFIVQLKRFLDEHAKLNQIRVDYQIAGDEAFMIPSLKQAVYRMICEACGNAVRHGHCSRVEVSLTISENKTVLAIHDNGVGIQTERTETNREKGIGLINMRAMVNAFHGKFSIKTSKGRGTDLFAEIPNGVLRNRQEVAGII